MKKYSSKIIIDYISGNDIEGYDLETLEDDIDFMMGVINYTNDAKMFDFCSDKVKNDYEFAKYIIYKFKNNLEFISSVADNFLDNNKDDFNRIELEIILRNLTNNNKKYTKYKVLSDSTYLLKMTKIEAIKQKYKNDDEVIDAIEIGFWFIIDEYNNNKIIMDFYTKKFIEDIITNNNMSLEDLLHHKFKKYEEIEKQGINNFLLGYLNLYDSNLSNYASCHLEVLDNLKEIMTKIKLRWNIYSSIDESKKYNKIFEFIHKYMKKYEQECIYGETEILYYIGKELGIEKSFLKYDDYYYDDINLINENVFKNEWTFLDFKHYNNIKTQILNIIGKKIIILKEETDAKPFEKNKSKCKILQLKFPKINNPSKN